MGKAGISHSLRNLVGCAGRRGGSIGYACIIAAMVIIIAFGVRQSSAAEAQPSAGKASGKLTIDGKDIPLRYSYAMAQPNTFDAAKTDTAVLLTSKPIAEGALRGIEDLMDATRQQHGWAFFKINNEGKPIYEVIDHPSTNGRISMSGFTHANFKSKKMGQDRVGGSFETSQTEDFMKYKYEIKVEFSAPLLKATLPEPLPDAKTGKALPADGGEPGKVYNAYRKAIRDTDIAALRKTAPASQAKDMSDSDLKKAIEFMTAISPGFPKINRGYFKGNRAVIYVEGVLEGEKQYGTVEFTAEGKTWFIEKESWSNTPPK